MGGEVVCFPLCEQVQYIRSQTVSADAAVWARTVQRFALFTSHPTTDADAAAPCERTTNRIRIAPATNVDWVTLTVVAAPVAKHGVNPHTKSSRGHLLAAKVNQ